VPERDPRRQAPFVDAKIEAVATASAIIDFLAESEGSVGVQQVAIALRMTKSRVSRHLANLESLGIVARLSTGRGYRLGWRVLRWGQIAARGFALGSLLAEPLRRLNTRTERTVLLCATAAGDAVVLQCLPARSAIRIEVEAGLVLSLPESPTARVSFAFQSRERREQFLAQTRQREARFRVEDVAAFNQLISQIQRNHYCWTRDKFNQGYGAVAAPVFEQEGMLAAVVTIMLPSAEFEGGPPPSLVNALLECCESSSRMLGSRLKFRRPSRTKRRVRATRGSPMTG
jgi:DNA-binding IclR family transcriptional regulator